jgi:hypothetical protein
MSTANGTLAGKQLPIVPLLRFLWSFCSTKTVLALRPSFAHWDQIAGWAGF